MPSDNLLVDRDGAVATITVNRPAGPERPEPATIDDLRRALLELRHDDAVRAIVLTGAGREGVRGGRRHPRARGCRRRRGARPALEGQHVFDLVEHLGKPVDRRHQRVRARRRLRARDGVHDSRRGRHGAVRPARDQARADPGLRRHAAAAAARGPRPRARAAAHGPRWSTPQEALRDRPGEPRRARRRRCSTTRRRSRADWPGWRRRRAGDHRSGEPRRSRWPLPEAAFLEAALFGLCFATERHARGHAGVPREARAGVHRDVTAHDRVSAPLSWRPHRGDQARREPRNEACRETPPGARGGAADALPVRGGARAARGGDRHVRRDRAGDPACAGRRGRVRRAAGARDRRARRRDRPAHRGVGSHWRPARMAVVDRLVLRLAVYELPARPRRPAPSSSTRRSSSRGGSAATRRAASSTACSTPSRRS